HQRHVARWGGEEFLILLPGTVLTEAMREAERIRHAVAALDANGRGLCVTLSAGVAHLDSGETLDDCLRRCDQALYRAKDAGRNTVAAAPGAVLAAQA
ncbi:MAG: GGDEF domain-containing protein, partial [Rudaea sp.]